MRIESTSVNQSKAAAQSQSIINDEVKSLLSLSPEVNNNDQKNEVQILKQVPDNDDSNTLYINNNNQLMPSKHSNEILHDNHSLQQKVNDITTKYEALKRQNVTIQKEKEKYEHEVIIGYICFICFVWRYTLYILHYV